MRPISASTEPSFLASSPIPIVLHPPYHRIRNPEHGCSSSMLPAKRNLQRLKVFNNWLH